MEPWRSDGTAAGTVMVDGSRLTSQLGSSDSVGAQMITLGGTLLFSADASTVGAELFAASAVPSQLTIYHQPKDQAISLGQTVVLTVGAIGPQPVTYQWKFKQGTRRTRPRGQLRRPLGVVVLDGPRFGHHSDGHGWQLV